MDTIFYRKIKDYNERFILNNDKQEIRVINYKKKILSSQNKNNGSFMIQKLILKIRVFLKDRKSEKK